MFEENKKKAIELKAENNKIQQLLKDSDNWRKANNLREYIMALEQNAIITKTLAQETKDYIKWAHSIANAIDPLQ